MLEQYGTIASVLLLLVTLYFLVSLRRETGQDAAECYRQAVWHCGEQIFKFVNVTGRLTGPTFRVETECHFKCHASPSQE